MPLPNDNWETMFQVQRRYRNAVFGHVASVLSERHGPMWFDEAIRPLLKDSEWQQLEANVPDRYDASGISIPVPLPFQWLGVPHITNIIQKHGRYLISNARSLQPMPRARRIEAVAKLSLQVRSIRDPLSHAPTADLPLRDLLYFTTAAQRVLEALGLMEAVEELDECLREANKPQSIQVESSLPPPSTIVRDFVGRESELEAFRDWLSADDEPIRIIAGGGGTGKSALAYQVALEQTRLPATRLNFIIWMTAKQRMLVRGKIVPTEADFIDENSALSKLWKFLGGDGEPEQATLFEYLSETPGLIIADDVDSLSGRGGDRAKALLTQEIPQRSRTKVLATSRRQLFGLEYATTVLRGFTRAETEEFLRHRLKEQGIPFDLSATKVEKIREATDGVPLYIEDLLRFIKTLDFESALQNWGRAAGEEAREYALKREFEVMPQNAKRILLAASRLDRPISAFDMNAILNVSEMAFHDAVEELRNLFFMSLPTFVEGVPRFTVGSTTTRLVNDVMQGEYEYEQICRAVDYYEERSVVGRDERGRVAEVHRLVRFLIDRGQLEEAVKVLDQASVDLPSNPDLYGTRGYLYKHWSPLRREDAEQAFASAADLHSKNPSVYWEWADLWMSQKEYQPAAEAAERGLVECESEPPQLLRIAGAARRDLGNRLVRNFQHGRAILEYRKARSHFRGMRAANEREDPRFRVNMRDLYHLNITLLDLMRQVDTNEDYGAEIRRLAAEWQRVEPDSGEWAKWLDSHE